MLISDSPLSLRYWHLFAIFNLNQDGQFIPVYLHLNFNKYLKPSYGKWFILLYFNYTTTVQTTLEINSIKFYNQSIYYQTYN